jgi:hypothetical protein
MEFEVEAVNFLGRGPPQLETWSFQLKLKSVDISSC